MTCNAYEKYCTKNQQQCKNCNSSRPSNKLILISFLQLKNHKKNPWLNSHLTFKTWFKEIPISGRRMSPAAFVAIVIFFWTISNDVMSMEAAVWFETGSSKMSANSVNCGRIFCVSVCSRAFVWLRTLETRLSTFLPAVNNSNKPLCKSSFPYSPKLNWKIFFNVH